MAECKIGVVGGGKMGEYHVGVLSDMREAELVGIVDSDQKRAKIVSERYKTSNYKSYKDPVSYTHLTLPTILLV